MAWKKPILRNEDKERGKQIRIRKKPDSLFEKCPASVFYKKMNSGSEMFFISISLFIR